MDLLLYGFYTNDANLSSDGLIRLNRPEKQYFQSIYPI